MHENRTTSSRILLMIAACCMISLLAGCAGTETRPPGETPGEASAADKGPSPLYYDFGDVLVPSELKMNKDESDIRALIRQYEFLTARENEVDAEASLKKYLELSGVDPLVLLSIKENLIKNSVEKKGVYFSILRNFIYVLDATGQLSRSPLRNYLSQQREVITQ